VEFEVVFISCIALFNFDTL